MDKDVLVTRVLEASAEGFKKLEGVSKTRFSYANLQKVVQEREYFLGITGLRGVGKTVLSLQLAKGNDFVYFSADDRNLRGTSVYEIVRALSEAGHQRIFIDEIHVKPDWDQDLKTIYDENLAYVAFTGSSAIELKNLKADLSRRVVLEHLKPASFREWLSIKKEVALPLLSLESLLEDKARIARDFAFANKFLREYCENGGVLYAAKTFFYKTIISSIETIAVKDFAAIKEVDVDTPENFFKLLYSIASAKPMELSYSTIGETLGRDKVWVMRFLSNVEKN